MLGSPPCEAQAAQEAKAERMAAQNAKREAEKSEKKAFEERVAAMREQRKSADGLNTVATKAPTTEEQAAE